MWGFLCFQIFTKSKKTNWDNGLETQNKNISKFPRFAPIVAYNVVD